MSDLYDVEIISRRGNEARVRLHMTLQGTSVSLGPSFARMLIEEESSPGYPTHRAWLRQKTDEDEDFSVQDSVSRVEVVSFEGLPRAPFDKPAEGASWGVVDLAITVVEPGLVSHWEPGMQWGSTAFDELDDGIAFTGQPHEARVWARG